MIGEQKPNRPTLANAHILVSEFLFRLHSCIVESIFLIFDDRYHCSGGTEDILVASDRYCAEILRS